MTHSRDQRGSAIVEAPIAIAVLLAIAFGAFWIANIGVRHHQLNEAASAASRYAARAYYAPGKGAERRRTYEEIEEFVFKSLGPLAELRAEDPDRVKVMIKCGPDLTTPLPLCPDPESAGPGDFIEVIVEADVTSDDPVTSLARSANSLFSSVGLGDPLPESVRAVESSIAMVE